MTDINETMDHAIECDDFDKIESIALNPKNALVRIHEFNMFLNTDARGYALKFFEDFSKDKDISKDWGGYGLIAPDFRDHN